MYEQLTKHIGGHFRDYHGLEIPDSCELIINIDAIARIDWEELIDEIAEAYEIAQQKVDIGRIKLQGIGKVLNPPRPPIVGTKTETLRINRQKFDKNRGRLLKEMLEAGQCYECVECGVKVDLTIDHIVPLSGGGTNDVENLQFLCKSHNSAKKDRQA